MTKAMPFLRKAILLSYDPPGLGGACFWMGRKGMAYRKGDKRDNAIKEGPASPQVDLPGFGDPERTRTVDLQRDRLAC